MVRPTYLVPYGWCQSFFMLDRLLEALLPRLTCVQNKQQTTHAFYLQTNGLENQTYTYWTMRTHIVGREKHFFIINFNESTYNVETGHCSANPDPGILLKCPPTSLLYISLCTRMAKGLGQWEYAIRQSFFTLFLLIFQMGPLTLLL